MSGAVTEAGQAVRMVRCEAHNTQYPQVSFPAIFGQERFWVGSCSLCDADAKLLERARRMEAATNSETMRHATKIVESSEKQIAKQAQSEIDDYVASCRRDAEENRPAWLADVRRRHWDAAV